MPKQDLLKPISTPGTFKGFLLAAYRSIARTTRLTKTTRTLLISYLLILVIIPPVLIMIAFFITPIQTAGFFNFQVTKPEALSENSNSKVLGVNISSNGNVLAAYTAAVLEPQAVAAVKALRVVAPVPVAPICLPGECDTTTATQTTTSATDPVVPGATVGPAAATGPQGPTGTTGATGATGATGPAGSSVTGVASLNTLTSGLTIDGAGLNSVSTLGSTITVTGTLPNTGTAGTYGSALNIPVFITDAQGRVTGVTDTTISGLTASNLAVGDFSSKITSGTYSINVSGNADTATSATNFSGSLAGDVTGTQGSTTVAKINGVTLGTTTATSGNLLIGSGLTWVTQPLSGDATITSGGVLTLKNTGTTGTYGSALNIPVFVTDAQGRVTGVTNTAIAGLTNSSLSGSAGITNANLANSGITTAGNSGSGSVSLGGTLTFTGAGITNIVASGGTLTITSTEADTLSTVTARGASTSTALTLNGGVTTTTSTALTLDSGTTGAVNIGNGANEKTITIGNTTGATAVNIQSGTGNINFTAGPTSSSSKVQIGNSGTATPDLLVLDNGTADPTGVNGGMYYNTTSGKLRCYENSAWDDCITDTTQNLKLTYKTADQTNTTTTLVNDTDLKFNVGANETWTFRFSLQLNSPSPADTQWNITTPAGVTNCKYAVTVYRNNTNTTSNVSCGTAATGIATTGNDEVIEVMGTIENGSTAGTVQLQWAENNSNGTMTVYRDSFLLSGKSTGADLAEMYLTNDASIVPGDVVSLDPGLQAGMKKSQKAYDQSVLGVISTKPGLVLGDFGNEGVKSMPVALSGRVPVKVSAQNGPIAAGDYLTSSSIPGVAMKATKAGAIIGTAMTSFEGEGIGQVLVFVKNGSSTGSSSEGIDVLMQLFNEPVNLLTETADSTVSSSAKLDTFMNKFFDQLSAWFADATNKIEDFFVTRVHTNEICLKKSDASEVCVNGDQLEKLMPTATPSPTPIPSSSPEITPSPTPIESEPIATESASPSAEVVP